VAAVLTDTAAKRKGALPRLRAARIVLGVDLARHGDAVLDPCHRRVIATRPSGGQFVG
jgi:hypothetical protein